MKDSIFTKIVNKELDCYPVYEDEYTLAFLDINPVSPGHTLVITKEQIDHLDDCSEQLYATVFTTVHKISTHLRKTLRPLRIALVVHGFDIPHAHVHVVPLYTGEELKLANRGEPNPDHVMLSQLSKQLRIK